MPVAVDAVVIRKELHVQDSGIGPGQLLFGRAAGQRVRRGIDLRYRILAAVHRLGLEKLRVDGVVVFGEEIGPVVAGDSAAGQIVGDVLHRAAGLAGDGAESSNWCWECRSSSALGRPKLIRARVDLIEIGERAWIGAEQELPLPHAGRRGRWRRVVQRLVAVNRRIVGEEDIVERIGDRIDAWCRWTPRSSRHRHSCCSGQCWNSNVCGPEPNGVPANSSSNSGRAATQKIRAGAGANP